MSQTCAARPRNRFNAAVGARIKARREALHLKQDFLASEIGRSVATVSKYEAGSVPCDTEMLAKIAKALNCEPGEFVNGIKTK